MKKECIPENENIKEKSGCSFSNIDEKVDARSIFCPAYDRYIPIDFFIVGICKDCYSKII